VNPKSYGFSCTSSPQCDNTAGLICLTTKCVCPAKTMWDGDSCGNYFFYLEN
jgi:hypothetical protein